MNIKSIHAQAPTRIDLAGGTLDIWPLYLFLKRPLTLNLAISLPVEVELSFPAKKTDDEPTTVTLISEDLGKTLSFPWSEFLSTAGERLVVPAELQLHAKLFQFFAKKRAQDNPDAPTTHLVLKSLSHSPAGAGLGGSSALSIALVGALATWADPESKPLRPESEGNLYIDIVRDIETQILGIPAGLQDYYAAMYGGLQAISWNVGAPRSEALSSVVIHELERRVLLFYSGQSRNSGTNNWQMFNQFFDSQATSEGSLRARFQQIADISQALRSALESHDWEAILHLVQEEWALRRHFTESISTLALDNALQAATDKHVLAAKVCGAGGGGCFFVYLAKKDPAARQQIVDIFAQHGMRQLEFHGKLEGLEIQIHHA